MDKPLEGREKLCYPKGETKKSAEHVGLHGKTRSQLAGRGLGSARPRRRDLPPASLGIGSPSVLRALGSDPQTLQEGCEQCDPHAQFSPEGRRCRRPHPLPRPHAQQTGRSADVAAAAAGTPAPGRPDPGCSARAGGDSGNCRQRRHSATFLPQVSNREAEVAALRVLRGSPTVAKGTKSKQCCSLVHLARS